MDLKAITHCDPLLSWVPLSLCAYMFSKISYVIRTKWDAVIPRSAFKAIRKMP